MLSRRVIRIKVLQVLYAHHKSNGSTLADSEKQLVHSMNKSYELYILIFLLLLEVKKVAEEKIELAKNKRLPKAEDLNPNTRFIHNSIFAQIEQNIYLNKYIQSKKLSWAQYPELGKKLFQLIEASDYYKDYMQSEVFNYREEKKILIKILKHIVQYFEDLYLSLEEQSIYWNDEIEFIISMNMKTIQNFKEEESELNPLLPLFKDKEDEQFAKELLRKTILKNEDYNKLITSYVKNWEFERIAFMDVLLIQLAITEVQNFEYIPVKVSMNEFLEIAKVYSTDKSSTFLNGIIDKIVANLKSKKQIKKLGRGLIGDQ